MENEKEQFMTIRNHLRDAKLHVHEDNINGFTDALDRKRRKSNASVEYNHGYQAGLWFIKKYEKGEANE